MSQSIILLELAQNSVKDGKLEKAIDIVWERLSAKSPLKSDFATLNGRWKDVEREELLGKIDFETFSRQRNKISSDFLNFVSMLSDDDLDLIRDPDKIAAHLFVLTPTDTTAAAMSKFFPFEYFRQVEFENEFDYQTLDTSGHNTIVVFDHYSHEGVVVSPEQREIQLTKLRWILANRAFQIVWFGGYHDMVKENSTRIGAANFPFTLYARIREMLDFLKYYQGKK